jgi:hypothetical protein
MSIAKPAAFEPTDKNAVIGIGAPWYTSGTHMWNGAAATLKPRPTRISRSAMKTVSGSTSPCWSAASP